MIESFCSSVQSRRRSTPVITSICRIGVASVLTLRSTLELKRSLFMGPQHAPARKGAEDVVGAPLTNSRVIAKMEDASVGSTMINLNQSVLRGIVIQAPPVEEQRAIAGFPMRMRGSRAWTGSSPAIRWSASVGHCGPESVYVGL